MNSESDYDWYVKTDLSGFRGKWVAIVDKKVVACNEDARAVVAEVKNKYPNSKPLLAKVSDEILIL